MEPLCSIIVPTRNRPDQLAACVAALARLDFPSDRYEVIIVDDGSEPPTVAPGVRVIRQPQAGPSVARNTGAREARGDLLVFTDDDCAPAPDWLRQGVARLAAAPGHLIGGRIRNGLVANPYAEASQMLVSYLYDYYNTGARGPSFFCSNNMAVARDLFLAIGGFDAALPRAAAEDRELCDRWLHCNHGMTYAPDMVVFHFHELTWRGFWRQHFNYGRGAHYFHHARAERRNARLRVEPVSFYLKLFHYPFTQTLRLRAFHLSLLLFVSQVANALGFFRQRWLR